ncbi:ImmA/IrrE family metallo-endopeptidase [uncultured Methylobacterium sp.]|uniref:ImmA/IrrE family metallo-endopeptidase n=1 Tax=uncultured Methylobacterium sp. TaxID=157278 RepID=UPI0025944FAD|nr:ImmA/IrrE family metallo-endopeptidase [uncultured Methylobacterium sp.]
MTPSQPVPTQLSKLKIFEIAEDVALRLNFESGDAMEPLVVGLGGRIEYKTSDELSGRLPESIIIRSVNDFTIFLPSITSTMRDRFTIAHELGHLFLHYPLVSRGRSDITMIATRWVDERNPDLIRTEWEANWFAAAFIMPSKQFKDALIANRYSVARVAEIFGVSPKAAEIRSRSLGVATYA